jgi:hypothetical protein
MNSPYYELVMDMISLAQVIFILMRSLQSSPTQESNIRWVIIQICINFCYLIEMIVDILSQGCSKAYDSKWRIWPETAC